MKNILSHTESEMKSSEEVAAISGQIPQKGRWAAKLQLRP